MEFTLFTSNTRGSLSNCVYKNKVTVTDESSLVQATSYDHVGARYKDSYRCSTNFISSDVLILDCDNSHSEEPSHWITPFEVAMEFLGVEFAAVYSRNHMKEKENKQARPRFHIYFPIEEIVDSVSYTYLKKKIANIFPYFDSNALDSARLIFGTESPKVEIYKGNMSILDYLETRDFEEWDDEELSIPEGRRNSTMSKYAGKIIKRYGNTEKAYIEFLRLSEKCSPPLETTELDLIWKSATHFFEEKIKTDPSYVAPINYGKDTHWEEPISFESMKVPTFPIEVLPKAIKDYVVALSENTQTPVDMAAIAALTVVASAMQGKYLITPKPNWIEPVNIFALNIMEPSERKSAVANAMTKPLTVFEERENMRNAAKIAASSMHKNLLEKRRRMLEDAIVKRKAGEDWEDKVNAISEEIASFKELKPLKLYVDDVTTEKLISLLADNNGEMSIISTEGGIFDTLAGTYSKMVNIDVFLKGYSGDSIRVERIGRTGVAVNSPRLTVFNTVQPTVLMGLVSNKVFRGRGLVARFLFSMPMSKVGVRKFVTPAIDDALYHEYEKCIINILEDEARGEIITLSDEAYKLLCDFATSLEPKLKTALEDMSDWAGKLVGNISRLSALLARSSIIKNNDFLGNNEPVVVSKEVMAGAIKLGEYFLEHAKVAFNYIIYLQEFKEIEKILEKLKEKGIEEFTVRDLMRLYRKIKSADEARKIIGRLIDYGYVDIRTSTTKGTKKSKKDNIYVVNPIILSQESQK